VQRIFLQDHPEFRDTTMQPHDQVLASLTGYNGARYLAGHPDNHASAKPDRGVRLPAIELSRTERARLLGLARTRSELCHAFHIDRHEMWTKP
jgi:hypothetical protein